MELIRQIVVEHSDSPLKEGRLVVVARDFATTAADLDTLAQLHLRWNRAWYGSALAVPLGMTTFVDSADLAADLRELSGGTADIADLRGRKLSKLDEVPVRPKAITPPPAEDDAVELLSAELPSGLPDDMEPALEFAAQAMAEPMEESMEGPIDELVDEPIEGTVAEMLAEPIEVPAFEQFEEPAEDELEDFEDDDLEPTAPFTVAPYLVADLDDFVEDQDAVPFEEGPMDQPAPVVDQFAELDEDSVEELPPPPEDDLPAPVLPLRDLRRSVRADVRLERPAPPTTDAPIEDQSLPAQRGPGEIAALLAGADLTVVPDHVADEAETASAPIIGAKIAHAREMLDMSIEELSQRTRIRPHVLEAMELDDFGPCGGDVYARGHLTSVARILGLTLEPLMQTFDERYSQGPINARRVFEAELSTGMSGGMRATFGGPRWSLLISAVLCLTMIWGLARIFAGDGEQLTAAPGASDVAVQTANRKPITSPMMKTTAMAVTAAHAPAHVVVRDRTGKILWSGDLGLGRHRKIVGLAPFKVESDNAGAVAVSVKGKALGVVGTAGEPGSKYFG